MKIANIILKDLKIILSDKKALAIMILMPVILTTILSFALKGSFADSDNAVIERVNIAVVKKYDEKQDQANFEAALNSSFLSSGMDERDINDLLESSDEITDEIFFDDFLDSEKVSEFISYRIEEQDQALKLLKSDEISAVVILPEKFIYDMKINFLTPLRNKINIEVLTHTDKSISGQIVKSLMDAYANAMSTVIIGKNVVIETAMANGAGSDSLSGMYELMEGMSSTMKSIEVNMDDVVLDGRKPVSSADYYAAGMMTMFILFAAGHGGRMLLEEKDNQTYQRMVVAGADKFEILAGKAITIFIIAIIQTVIMIVYSHFALKVQWGDRIAVAMISISAAAAVAGLGSFVGALTYRAGNYKMANIFESAIVQGMALLGGSFFPLDVMPEFMQRLGFLSLNGVALKAYLKVISGGNAKEILGYVSALTVMGAVFAILAVMILTGRRNGYAEHNKTKSIKA
ncbi:MAG TPA: hypothetical protein DC038_11620 [Clostridiales bacterium]|nr:hypothetical protein [Clostridiales bacterium]